MMSLRLSASSQKLAVMAGFAFNMDISPSPGGIDAEIYYHDLLLNEFRSRIYICGAGLRQVSQLFGLRDVDGDLVDMKISHKPLLLHNSEQHNRTAYGSFYQNLSLAGQVLTGATPFGAPAFEHPMRHSTLSGKLLIPQQSSFLTESDLNFYGHQFKVRHPNGNVYQYFQVSDTFPNTGVINSWYAGFPHTILLEDLLSSLKGVTIEHVGSDGQLTRRVLSDVKFDVFDSGLRATYVMQTFNLETSQYCKWTSTLQVPFRYPVALVEPVIGVNYSTTYNAAVVFSAKAWVINPDGSQEYQERTYEWGGIYSAFPVCLSDSSLVVSASTDTVRKVSSDLTAGRFIAPFVKAINSEFTEFVPSSVFSSVDAFNAAEGYLGTNVLQNLAKIPGIVDSLPQLREAVHILGRLLNRDLSFSTFKEILDLATSTHLQASFEWRPWASIIQNYTPALASTFSTLGLTTGRAVGYGSFKAALPNAGGRKDVVLVTRTKIVMSTSANNWLSTLTGIDALGILPKPSNLWDLIPFTFLVNWFTGVGASMRRAESSLMMAMIPAYYVHTYAFTSPLTEDELQLLRASSDRDHIASIRYYVRDVTNFPPVVRDSKYDFGIPSGIPFAGTLGSLAYQLIFG
jgi:hypothetical protein